MVEKMQAQKSSSVYDIYVIKTSGVPLFAGCTGSDYCKLHLDQHELQSGFIAAIYSFSREVFKTSDIKTILYEDIQLNFKTDEEHGLIFVFVHPISAPQETIKMQLEAAYRRFVERYRDYLAEDIIDEEIFESFQKDLNTLGITPHEQLMSVKEMQKLQKGMEKKKPNLWTWLRSKISRN